MLVLAVVALRALNTSFTGAGSALEGTVSSFSDGQHLSAIFQSLAANAHFSEGRLLVPSDIAGRSDGALNSTADLFSAMIANHVAMPDQLISANEYSPLVWPDDDYDFTAYDPAAGVFWDPGFVADLALRSNVSFAHVPLYGERLRRQWLASAGHRAVLLGNRGPRDGVQDPSSYSCGRNGLWAGHLVFGDGHVEFANTFTPPGLSLADRASPVPDNVFAMEEGPGGLDAILTFTKRMTESGPEIQHD